LPVSEIDWIQKKDKEFIDILEDCVGKDEEYISDADYFVYSNEQRSEMYRFEYLKNAIMISEWTDGSVILLNPNVWYGDDCEAWIYANWYPGAHRFKSFAALIENELNSTIEMLNNDQANESAG